MTITQVSFQFRADDGDEAGASALADINVSLEDFSDLDSNIRLRYQSSVSDIGETFTPQVRYSHNGGAYTNIDATSSVVRSSASANLTDGNATTEQLAGAGTFIAGAVDDNDGVTGGISLTPGQDTEHEYCFQVRSDDVQDGDTIDFRLYDSSLTPYDAYTVTARITINLTDVVVRGGMPTMQGIGSPLLIAPDVMVAY